MQLVSALTGVTQSDPLKCEKPISAIVVTFNGAYSTLTDEEIKVFIESSEGRNIDIIKAGIKLKHVFLLSQLGEGAGIDDAAESQVFVKLTPGNALSITNNEKIMVEAKALDALKTYSIDGLELPVAARQTLEYERKVILAGDTTKELDVREFNGIVIENRANIEALEITYNNGITCKYNKRLIRHLMHQINDVAVTSVTAANQIFGLGDFIAMALNNASRISIETDGTETEVILSKVVNY